jgi:hypothetical protein
MSGQIIYDEAPLGALIRYSDGTPRPPARFTRKLSAWERSNGVGRLIRKSPPQMGATYSTPAGFTLHHGDFGTGGVIVLVVTFSYLVTSALRFEIIDAPRPGMVRVLTSWAGIDELRHLAPDLPAAEAWLATHGYSNARLDVVGGEPIVPADRPGRAA